MKKIAFFCGFYLPHLGGVERYTSNLIKELKKKYEIIIVTSNDNNYATIEDLDGVKIYRLPVYSVFKNRFPLLKKNTEAMLEEKLPKWSKKMNLEYQGYKVRDTVSKYGSCVPQTKMLYFSARLKMLTGEQVDSIIVHELAHLVHANHQKPFYDLVKKYIPNYDEIHQELKKNQKRMMI